MSVEGSSLVIPSASRVHIGTYYCIASNGVPPTKSKSIRLRVQCESMLIVSFHLGLSHLSPEIAVDGLSLLQG